MSIFKKTANNNEIAEEMFKQLSKSTEDNFKFDTDKVVNYITNLAKKFELKGMVREAEFATQLLEAYSNADLQQMIDLNKKFEENSQEPNLEISDEDEKNIEQMFSSFDDEE